MWVSHRDSVATCITAIVYDISVAFGYRYIDQGGRRLDDQVVSLRSLYEMCSPKRVVFCPFYCITYCNSAEIFFYDGDVNRTRRN